MIAETMHSRKYLLLVAPCLFPIVHSITLSQMQDMVFNSPPEKEMFEYWQTSHDLRYDILECLLVAEERIDQIPAKNEWLRALDKFISS